MPQTIWFTLRQAVLVGMAALAYFGVRGLTEAEIEEANENAAQILDFERLLGLDLELGLQSLVRSSEWLIDLANWVYIWAHWPLVAATLVFLAVRRRSEFFELRNAMFISGAIGLLIFATYAVAPPRLFAPEYVDTVTERSISYRVLQPPGLVNKFAAVPSLHFGWNLLVGLSWRRLSNRRVVQLAGVLMPVAMAFAVVATANHWTFDVFAGAAVALSGLGLERLGRRYLSLAGLVSGRPEPAGRLSEPDGCAAELADDATRRPVEAGLGTTEPWRVKSITTEAAKPDAIS